MAKTKYIARIDGKIVGTRTSDRTYTHAIVVYGHGKSDHVATWCGRPDLAVKEQRKYLAYGYQVQIAEVEALVKPSNARTAKAFNDSGVFAPFICIGKD